jgi:ATP-dependent RNA helicase DDX6/DHH1
VLARAKNGTGKTAAFCIPMLQQVDASRRRIQALVLVPTRELALQTASVLKQLGKHTGAEVVSITGGNPLRDDILRLQAPQGVHVLVGTPGRIKDLAAKGVADLSACRMVAVDEADKLLSAEFQVVIEDLLANDLPRDAARRQVLLFSATFPESVIAFRDKYMPHAYEINLMEELTLKGVSQFYAFVEERQKIHCLNTLFTKLEINQSIMWVLRVTEVCERLFILTAVNAHISPSFSPFHIAQLLQQRVARRASRQAHHGARLQLLLHPR